MNEHVEVTKIKSQQEQSHSLLKFGIVLFLLGLITGFVIPALANPRMGLSSHLEGVMNGMFLLVLGLIWTKLQLSAVLSVWGFRLAIFGTYVNWATTLFAAIIGGGAEMMPFAGAEMQGSPFQEIIIKTGLITLSVSMVIVSGIVIYGLSKQKTS